METTKKTDLINQIVKVAKKGQETNHVGIVAICEGFGVCIDPDGYPVTPRDKKGCFKLQIDGKYYILDCGQLTLPAIDFLDKQFKNNYAKSLESSGSMMNMTFGSDNNIVVPNDITLVANARRSMGLKNRRDVPDVSFVGSDESDHDQDEPIYKVKIVKKASEISRSKSPNYVNPPPEDINKKPQDLADGFTSQKSKEGSYFYYHKGEKKRLTSKQYYYYLRSGRMPPPMEIEKKDKKVFQERLEQKKLIPGLSPKPQRKEKQVQKLVEKMESGTLGQIIKIKLIPVWMGFKQDIHFSELKRKITAFMQFQPSFVLNVKEIFSYENFREYLIYQDNPWFIRLLNWVKLGYQFNDVCSFFGIARMVDSEEDFIQIISDLFDVYSVEYTKDPIDYVVENKIFRKMVIDEINCYLTPTAEEVNFAEVNKLVNDFANSIKEKRKEYIKAIDAVNVIKNKLISGYKAFEEMASMAKLNVEAVRNKLAGELDSNEVEAHTASYSKIKSPTFNLEGFLAMQRAAKGLKTREKVASEVRLEVKDAFQSWQEVSEPFRVNSEDIIKRLGEIQLPSLSIIPPKSGGDVDEASSEKTESEGDVSEDEVLFTKIRGGKKGAIERD